MGMELGEFRLRVFENRVLGKIFGPEGDEVIGEWRKLHNEELNDLYCKSNVVRETKSRRMRWAGHVGRMGPIWTGGKSRPHWNYIPDRPGRNQTL